MHNQPRFPTYHGPPLPQVLNPLNPRHYWLLFMWIFFQPSRLLHYLRQADEELYEATGWAFFKVVRVVAIRNLYLQSVILTLILSASLAWISSIIQETPVDWSGVAFGVAGGVGGSRLIFYFLELPFSWFHSHIRKQKLNAPHRLAQHPALWDELAVWPLHGTAPLLQAALSINFPIGMRQLMRVAANPFQRGVAQRALSDWLTQQTIPLPALYDLSKLPALDEYLFPPLSKQHFYRWPSARVALLSELGQQFIAATSNSGENSEKLVWRLTKRQRRMVSTPLSQFSHLLRDLYRDQTHLATAPLEQFETLLAPDRFQAVAEYPHGAEITASFNIMRHFLSCQTVDDLNAARDHLQVPGMGHITSKLPKSVRPMPGTSTQQPFIRPPVIQALHALGDVGQQTSRFTQATNVRQKSTALNLAAGQLNELESYIREHVLPPERVLLIRIVQLWQDIVAATQGEFAQSTLQQMSRAEQRQAALFEPSSTIWQRPAAPIDNPYIVGNPVSPPLFVGRNDIFNRISDVWTEKENPDSVILYGHRRMGKSSILRNLDQAAPSGSLIVYADMGGETSFVDSTADLLLGLADKIYHAARRAFPNATLSEPDPARYSSAAKATFQFKRLAEQVRDGLDGNMLILALDEFEAIERAVANDKISADIFQFLRTTSQEPWITFIFGGLHTLDEMSRDYQQPFHASYVNILVSYLSHDAAWHLITDPAPNFKLNYEPAAVEQIIAVSGGQPSLLQQLCRDALNHLNHELFDLNLKRDVLIKLSDVEAVLDSDFFRRGAVYFDGVWHQTENKAQRTLLRQMATHCS